MKCPSCGLENADDETYCGDCGALLTSAPVVLQQRVRNEPLALGVVLNGMYRIEAAETGGVFIVYRVTELDGDQGWRIIEDAEAPLLDMASISDPGEPLGDDASRATRVWRALSGISNPHLWEVRSFFYAEGRALVVGTPVPEWNLTEYLQESDALTPEEVRALGLALLEALSVLHQRGFLHLGVVPEHIYINDDGLALLNGFERLTTVGSEPGVHSVIEGYSAPEAYGIGGRPCPASDVYGVGVTLYFAMSRIVPSAVSREQFFVFPPLSARVANVPSDLEQVIMKALRKEAQARYATALEMHEELEAATLSPRTAEVVALEPVTVGAGAATVTVQRAGAQTSTSSRGLAVPPRPVHVLPAAVPRIDARGFCPFRVGMKSHIGCVRSVNQDSLLVMSFVAIEHSTATQALLVVVADGMGGEVEGDKAASLAIRVMASSILQDNVPLRTGMETVKLRPQNPVERLEELLREAMEESNRVIYDYSQADSARRGMGSTLTALMIDWPHAVFGHAGDTRAYLLRNGTDAIDQVTEDHSLVGRLVRLGQLTREEARTSPQRSFLYRAMGTQSELEMDIYTRTLEPGDRLLICSDGVWEYYSEAEVGELLAEGTDPQATCDRIIEETLRRGADDNCTAVILHVPALAS